MKVAVTTTGRGLDDALSVRFGRAPGFLIYDTDTDRTEPIPNATNVNAAQGAGIQAAQTVAESGAECLITGHVGPKAFRVLAAAGITVYTSEAATVRAALEDLKAGRLEAVEAPDVQGHWA
jgi:predicted Fe-Mo cluster-binding NifX family protein